MPKTVTAHRLLRVAEMIRENSADALLVSHAGNRRYLTGFRDDDDQVDESSGWVIVEADGTGTLFCSAMDAEEAARDVGSATIIAVPAPLADGIVEAITAHMREHKYAKVGFEPHLAWHRHAELSEALPRVTFEPLWGLVEWTRMVKDAGEIAAVRRAAALTDSAYAAAIAAMRPGVTEAAIAWVIDRYFREHGGDPTPAFPTIVAAGINAALPHHIPDDTPLQMGEPIILDLGARVDGYCADITRTVALGHADDYLRRIHRAIIVGMEAGIAMLRPGVIAQDAANAAITIVERDYGFTPAHTLGHGVGLIVHEWPWVSPQEDGVTLAPGMLATAEPGYYDTAWGGVRVEETVLITAVGPEILSKASRALIVPT